MKNKVESIDLYWKKKEQELGEVILQTALLHVITTTDPNLKKNSWCLGVVTDNFLFIEGEDNRNTICGIPTDKGVRVEERASLIIERKDIIKIENLSPQGFFAKLLQTQLLFSIVWGSQEKEYRLVVEVEPKSRDIVDLLCS